MATTGIWKIEKRLDHVIKYITNVEKTINENYDKKSYQELHNLSEYSDCDYASEKQYYVSALNCTPETAYQEMMITKKQWHKTGGIIGFHAFQSFAEDEVTPSQAHLIGLKLAEEIWGDRFEVVVSTHINTKHIHNHFVINSVSFLDGKKYYDNRENYARIRQISDSLCMEYGLNVLEEKTCKRSGINYANYYKGYVKNNNYYKIAKEDVDKAIGMANSYNDFESILKKMGYEVNIRYEKITIKRYPYKKNIRIERAFGEDYSISSICERIINESKTKVPFIEALNPNIKYKQHLEMKKQKAHGLYGLYKYYCYLLNVYPTNYPRKIIPVGLRVDIEKMNEISKQTELLVSNKIETNEQFLFYKDNIKLKIDSLIGDRENLWLKHKRCNDDSQKTKIKLQIDSITKELNKLRKEVKLCDGIENRIDVIKDNIKEFEEKENGKEKI